MQSINFDNTNNEFSHEITTQISHRTPGHEKGK